MKKKVFLDTGGLGALVDGSQPEHCLAKKVFDRLSKDGYELWTTDAVMDEFVTLMRARFKFSTKSIFQCLHDLFVSDLNVIEVGRDEFGRAMVWMNKFSDHILSLTDCMSFVTMKKLKIKEAFTTDRDFEVVGFTNLLK